MAQEDGEATGHEPPGEAAAPSETALLSGEADAGATAQSVELESRSERWARRLEAARGWTTWLAPKAAPSAAAASAIAKRAGSAIGWGVKAGGTAVGVGLAGVGVIAVGGPAGACVAGAGAVVAGGSFIGGWVTEKVGEGVGAGLSISGAIAERSLRASDSVLGKTMARVGCRDSCSVSVLRPQVLASDMRSRRGHIEHSDQVPDQLPVWGRRRRGSRACDGHLPDASGRHSWVPRDLHLGVSPRWPRRILRPATRTQTHTRVRTRTRTRTHSLNHTRTHTHTHTRTHTHAHTHTHTHRPGCILRPTAMHDCPLRVQGRIEKAAHRRLDRYRNTRLWGGGGAGVWRGRGQCSAHRDFTTSSYL